MSFTLEDVEKRSLPILTGVRDSSFPKGIITKINWVGNLTLLLMLPPNQLSATTAVRKITFLLIVHIPRFKKKIKYPSRPLLRVDPLLLPHPAPKILQLWYALLELLTTCNILTRFTWSTTTTLGLPLSQIFIIRTTLTFLLLSWTVLLLRLFGWKPWSLSTPSGYWSKDRGTHSWPTYGGRFDWCCVHLCFELSGFHQEGLPTNHQGRRYARRSKSIRSSTLELSGAVSPLARNNTIFHLAQIVRTSIYQRETFI